MKSNTTSGFTLIELIVVIIILSVIGAILLPVLAGRTGDWRAQRQSEVMAQLTSYAASADMKAISCTGQDSDGDGYISCTAKQNNDTGSIVALECGYGWNTGCKLAQAKNINYNN